MSGGARGLASLLLKRVAGPFRDVYPFSILRRPEVQALRYRLAVHRYYLLHAREHLGYQMPRYRYIVSLYLPAGIRGTVRVFLARYRYLRAIELAPPKAVGALGSPEVHMLIHHARIREGAWALYSLAHVTGGQIRPVVHDDGTLTEADSGFLRRLLPGVRIIPRGEADALVEPSLVSRGLHQCAAWRRIFKLSLKIFDICLLAEDETFGLMDSDVLFFNYPRAFLEADHEARGRAKGSFVPRFMVDQLLAYSLPKATVAELVGDHQIHQCNTGLVWMSGIDLHHIEENLGHYPPDGSARYHAWTEQTLLSIELLKLDAEPLPPAYRTMLNQANDSSLVCGHFCGDTPPLFQYYTDGLPRAAQVCEVRVEPMRIVIGLVLLEGWRRLLAATRRALAADLPTAANEG